MKFFKKLASATPAFTRLVQIGMEANANKNYADLIPFLKSVANLHFDGDVANKAVKNALKDVGGDVTKFREAIETDAAKGTFNVASQYLPTNSSDIDKKVFTDIFSKNTQNMHEYYTTDVAKGKAWSNENFIKKDKLLGKRVSSLNMPIISGYNSRQRGVLKELNNLESLYEPSLRDPKKLFSRIFNVKKTTVLNPDTNTTGVVYRSAGGSQASRQFRAEHDAYRALGTKPPASGSSLPGTSSARQKAIADSGINTESPDTLKLLENLESRDGFFEGLSGKRKGIIRDNTGNFRTTAGKNRAQAIVSQDNWRQGLTATTGLATVSGGGYLLHKKHKTEQDALTRQEEYENILRASGNFGPRS